MPTAVPLRVDQDLVSVSDIAQRVGRTRESVRLLVDGKRGPGRFPPPIGVVGDGIRVWPWSAALEWFQNVLVVDLGQNGVPPLTAAVLDVSFATRRSPELASALLDAAGSPSEPRASSRRHGSQVAAPAVSQGCARQPPQRPTPGCRRRRGWASQRRVNPFLFVRPRSAVGKPESVGFFARVTAARRPVGLLASSGEDRHLGPRD